MGDGGLHWSREGSEGARGTKIKAETKLPDNLFIFLFITPLNVSYKGIRKGQMGGSSLEGKLVWHQEMGAAFEDGCSTHIWKKGN